MSLFTFAVFNAIWMSITFWYFFDIRVAIPVILGSALMVVIAVFNYIGTEKALKQIQSGNSISVYLLHIRQVAFGAITTLIFICMLIGVGYSLIPYLK